MNQIAQLAMSERSVLFITVDSCRYDSFSQARTPTFDSLGHTRAAGTHGTYTLPAHMSFFMGYLPSVIKPPFNDFYSPEVRQLWRLASGRQRDPMTIGVSIDGESVPKSYAKRGFRVIGAGGVRWFRHPALAKHFDTFHFYGKNDFVSVFTEREASEFPLNHIDELVDEIGSDPFFLFINCPETHVPYDCGVAPLPESAKETIKKHKNLWGLKKAFSHEVDVDTAALAQLQKLQVAALEEVDRKVGILLSKISHPLLVVIAGDHGECFGEDGMWGHGYPHEKVTEVPLLIATVN
ncbi:sulfatase-like hydrolase/transferase [Pseudomonas tremae]|uniref:sulfatase-like hydrolase/transferase n=1 Tax=Pseudomonas tremae TaxID=200454 RepID=UPI0011823AD6|nr:sulfatase-like hydrolase/transferase [Pseudomonas tremae]